MKQFIQKFWRMCEHGNSVIEKQQLDIKPDRLQPYLCELRFCSSSKYFHPVIGNETFVSLCQCKWYARLQKNSQKGRSDWLIVECLP